MAAAWLNEEEEQFSASIKQVLPNSRKSSTRMAYLAKWKRFSVWYLDCRIQLMWISI